MIGVEVRIGERVKGWVYNKVKLRGLRFALKINVSISLASTG